VANQRWWSAPADPTPPPHTRWGTGVGSAGAEEIDVVVEKNYRDKETNRDREQQLNIPDVKGQEIDQDTRNTKTEILRSQEARRPETKKPNDEQEDRRSTNEH
jgi:hypothetical protein